MCGGLFLGWFVVFLLSVVRLPNHGQKLLKFLILELASLSLLLFRFHLFLTFLLLLQRHTVCSSGGGGGLVVVVVVVVQR